MFHIQHHERIGSTNDEARRLAARVRRMAPWSMPTSRRPAGDGLAAPGSAPPGNLYLSVLLRLDLPPARGSELSFVTALTVADAIDALLPKTNKSTLKWPNDVLVNDGKIAGILVESVDDAQIIGIGVNVLEARERAIQDLDAGWRAASRPSMGRAISCWTASGSTWGPGWSMASSRSVPPGSPAPIRSARVAGEHRRPHRGGIVRRARSGWRHVVGYAGRAEAHRRRRGQRGQPVRPGLA